MAVNPLNLIAGPADVFTGDFGTTEPVAIDDVLDAGWEDVGGTKDGVSLKITQAFYQLEVDQIVDVPGSVPTKREISVMTNFAEPTLENLRRALNGGTITEPAVGDSTRRFEPIDPSPTTAPDYSAVLFRGLAPEGFPRIVIVRRTLSVGDVTFAYKKGDQVVYTAEFTGHYVSSSVRPFAVLDGTDVAA